MINASWSCLFIKVFYVLFPFLKKAENNRSPKNPVHQNFVILFFCFHLKYGQSGP